MELSMFMALEYPEKLMKFFLLLCGRRTSI